MKLWAGLLTLWAMWCFSTAAHAAEPARFALIINQVHYESLTPLPDTDGEAKSVGDSLKKIGFDVTLARDANLTGLQTALKDFRRKLAASPGAIGFIYYTGHGMADPTDEKGDNYLLGIDADVKIVADLPASGIKLGDLVTQMSRTDASAVIIVVDACRNTPSLGKAATKGLVAVAAEPNTLVAYSTDLGDIASVGVYAPVLSRELVKPGLSVTQVFDAVQIEVSKQTGRKQRPWSNNRIYDVICLAGCTINVAPTVVNQPETVEQTFWASAKDCGDYRAYLKKYPSGDFADLANSRLAAPLCNISNKPVSWDPGLSAPVKAGAVALCDLKAGAQYDDDRLASNGFADFITINSADAVNACQTALNNDPDNRHLMVNLGRAYLAGSSFDMATGLFKRAADLGSGEGMFEMGVMANKGGQDPSGDATARQWFRKAADAGNVEGTSNLAALLAAGRGGSADLTEALTLYGRSAQRGEPFAMTGLGTMYFYGQGTTQNYSAALQWFKAAADRGYAPAMTTLGYMYENGTGVAKDYSAARTLYEQATALNNVDAMASLGTLYYNGTGVTRDLVTARRYFDAAAQRGNVGAMASVGFMNQNGLGGSLDLNTARYWYQQASQMGNAWATEQLKTLPAG